MVRPWSWKRTLVALAAVATLTVTGAMVSPAASAHGAKAQAPAAACDSGSSFASPPWSGLYLRNYGAATCWGGPANSDTYVKNCSSTSHILQADTWLTQQNYPGGTRLAESGRSSWVSYPVDCTQEYHVNNASLWNPPSPLWSCAWWQAKDSNNNILWSQDYVCNSHAG